MNRRSRKAWAILAAATVAVGAALAYLGDLALDLERRELRARWQNESDATLRLALWRMDSWLGPQLAREAMRPHYEYQQRYVPPRGAPSADARLHGGVVPTPSPLLGWQHDVFPLHFQLDAAGTLTSPQSLEVLEVDFTITRLPAAERERRTRLFAELREFVTRDALAAKVGAGEAALPPLTCSILPPQQLEVQQGDNFLQNRQEYQSRAQVSHQWNTQRQPTYVDDAIAGPLLPVWLEDPRGVPRLVFARRVRIGGQTWFQGVLADWDQLRTELVAQCRDLFGAGVATLARVDAPTPEQQGAMLATVPAVLAVAQPLPALPFWTPMRGVLLAAVAAMLVALGGVALTLRSTLAFGERRARFASAVTHELRTPLTTFRMYSEMLATGVVRGEDRRREYLETLQREADRLARLVENVLGYARLEEGRYRGRRERMTGAELLARVLEPLRQRAAQAAVQLVVADGAGPARVEVDADAVTQILFNLVDNACKYAATAEPRELRLELGEEAGTLVVRVRDFGPGVPAAYRRRIFAPFDRGGRETAENQTPGVGLGLALARGLARELGGDLVLEESARGAVFALRLPAC